MFTRKETDIRLQSNISSLPQDIQDKIWKYYYSYDITVINEQIRNVISLEHKLLLYFDKIIRLPTHMKNTHINELQKLNFHIEKIVQNPGLLFLCKHHNLLLRHCFQLPKYLILSVHPTLKYVAHFCLCSTGELRYMYLKKFQDLTHELKSTKRNV